MSRGAPIIVPPDLAARRGRIVVGFAGGGGSSIATAADLADPLGTVTSRSRFSLVLVAGQAWRIADIGMRMLDPETELAPAMGVPRDYVLGFDVSGARVSKTDVTKMVGNMVSPPPAVALIRANLPRAAEPERAAA